MLFHQSTYRVTTQTAVMPQLDAFDFVFDPYHLSVGSTEFFMARILRFEYPRSNGFSIALLDRILSDYEACAVAEETVLTTILFDSIVQIDPYTGKIVLHRECRNMGGLQAIFRIDDGYILGSEGELFRYDQALNQIWSFSGRDIFGNPHTDKVFWLEHNQIHCVDWEGWHFVLDLNGRLISETQKHPVADA